jgi:hypothetical protein
MKTVSITIVLVSLLLLSVGCNVSAKKNETFADKPIAQKKPFNPVEDVKGLCRGTIFFVWDVITLGYDKKEHPPRKELDITYRQANNAGFLQLIGSFANGYTHGGGYHAGWNDRYRDRGYRSGYGNSYNFGH